MKCVWFLLIYVIEVFYVRVKDIDFSFVNKFKENFDIRIDSLDTICIDS